MDLKGNSKVELLEFILWLSHEYGFQDGFLLNKGVIKALIKSPQSLNAEEISVFNNLY